MRAEVMKVWLERAGIASVVLRVGWGEESRHEENYHVRRAITLHRLAAAACAELLDATFSFALPEIVEGGIRVELGTYAPSFDDEDMVEIEVALSQAAFHVTSLQPGPIGESPVVRCLRCEGAEREGLTDDNGWCETCQEGD